MNLLPDPNPKKYLENPQKKSPRSTCKSTTKKIIQWKYLKRYQKKSFSEKTKSANSANNISKESPVYRKKSMN